MATLNGQARPAEPREKPQSTIPSSARQAPRPPGNHLGTLFDPNALEVVENDQIQRTPMALVMLTAFLGGLILNLMPCVLPVIGLKILSFLEQSGHDRRHALLLNVWYSLGLLSVFLVLATLAVIWGFGWGQLFSYNGFNIALVAVVFAMGLSFLGVWEIPIPGFVGRGKTMEMAEKEGFAGAFSKGVITTILATPCTAPFLASALTWAASQPPPKTYAVFVAVGLGMASPYLLIGAFPKLIGFLPKPGAWMDTFKQIMGFVLLATVVFLLTFITQPLVVPTVGFLFGIWGACWWIGRMPAWSTPGHHRPCVARSGGLCRSDLDCHLRLAFRRHAEPFRPLGRRGNRRHDDSVLGPRRHRSCGQANSPPRGQQASSVAAVHAENAGETISPRAATVLVDFTADWCLTCKTLEAAVLNTARRSRGGEGQRRCHLAGRLDPRRGGGQ